MSATPPLLPAAVPLESIPPAAPPRWRWWLHLLLIALYPILTAPLFMWHEPQGPALSSDGRGALLVSIVSVLVFATFYVVGCRISRASAEELLLPWRPGWMAIPLGVFYSVAIRLVVAVVALIGLLILIGTGAVPSESVEGFVRTNRPDVEALVDVRALRHNPAYYWLTVTVVSFVVAGLREEMWRAGVLAGMRALWPRYFSSLRGQIVAVCLIAVVFGLWHLRMGPVAVFFAGLLGVLLGLIMVLHKSIWPAVLAHGFFDATSFALIPFVLQHLQQL